MQLTGWPEYFAIAYLPIFLIGFIGNFLSLYVYTTPKMRKSTVAFLLYSLSISDIFVLAFALPLYSISHLPWDDPLKSFSIRRSLLFISMKYFYPLCMIAKTVSLYIMVLITVERWIAVCRPLQVHYLCTFRNSVKAVLFICVFSFFINVSKFWEYDLIYINKHGYFIAPGLLDSEKHWWYFMIYFIVISVVFDYLLPFVIMFIANMKVINELRRSRKERLLLTTSQLKDQNTTVMLLMVTILFAFCHFFGMALKIAESVCGDFLTSKSVNFEIIGDVCNFMIVLHIATTFFIYYIFSARFRMIIQNFFKKRRNNSRSRKYLTSTFTTNMMTKTSPL